MIKLELRALLFALGFCLGLHLWALCSQLIVLALYAVIFSIVLHEVPAWSCRSNQRKLTSQLQASDDAAFDHSSFEVAASQFILQSAPPSSARIAGQARLQSKTSNPSLEPALLEQPPGPKDRTAPSQPCYLLNAGHQLKASRWESMLQDARRSRASDSECSMLLTHRYERHIPMQSAFMNRAERAVILAWLRGVVPGEPQSENDNNQFFSPSPSTPPPMATFTLPLPLTTRLLAAHLATPHNFTHSCPTRIEASHDSSPATSCSPDVRSCATLIPIKRTADTSDSSTHSLPYALRSAKMQKTHPCPTADTMLLQPRAVALIGMGGSDESFNTFSTSSSGEAVLIASHDTSHQPGSVYEMEVCTEERQAAPVGRFGRKRCFTEEADADDEDHMHRRLPRHVQQNAVPKSCLTIATSRQIDNSVERRLLSLAAKLNE